MSIITIPKTNSSAKLQLLCFPFAGGGTRTYLSWYQYLPNIELCLVAYPGREHRIKEKPITDIDILLDELVNACKKVLTKDFIIFGHSMGSIVSYGVAKKLESAKLFPKALIVSAAAAPTRTLPKENMLSLLPDNRFIQTLVERYDAIPEIILQDKNLMQLFIPMLRNDISIEEQYVTKYGSVDKTPIFSNISAFGGIDDIAITRDHLMTWKKLTTGTFNIKTFPGTHFYLNEYSKLLFKEINTKYIY